MIYNIETLSKSDLFRLIMGIHDHYKIDAIDAGRIIVELGKTELSDQQKRTTKDIANTGYPSGKLWETAIQMNRDKEKDETNEPYGNHLLSGNQKECSDNSADIRLNIVGRVDLESINQRMRPEKKIRLNKVATELNVGIRTIVEFLSKKGHNIEAKPNTKITNQQYDLVLAAFGNERVVKEKSNKKDSIRTGGNRVINIGDNNPKQMSKNAKKKERKRAERRAMMATKDT